jgi:3-phosphoshikimate 1-carboxyvinyltransferase
MIIRPATRVRGDLLLPGDKSISHRAAIMAALAEGATRIENFAPGADCASTLSCLKQLGVAIEREENTVIIHGVGKRGLRASAGAFDCGNSGTTMRLMAGVLAGQNFTSVLTGDGSLSKRPMGRIVGPLTQMGAVIESVDGNPPLTIHGNPTLNAISYALPKPSAQLKSCILLAGLFGNGITEVIEAIPTRDHTEKMLPHFGAAVQTADKEDGVHICVSGDTRLTANDLTVPADISSAAFFLIAAACLPGSELVLRDLGLNPSRVEIMILLQTFGIDIRDMNVKFMGREPVGDVVIRGAEQEIVPPLNLIDGHLTAAMIDEIPVLAVLGTRVEGGLEIRDAQELRVKESDRIKSVVQNLRTMEATVEEFSDGLRVGRSKLKGAKVDSFDDHRIAMAFAVAALLAEGESEITGADCVDISYPGFFQTLEQITE